MKNGIELRHLRYFAAVAECLNFGRAAAALHMSQPPLTRQLHDLESYVGTALIERRPRSLALTPAGSTFLEESLHILDQIPHAVRQAHRAAAGEIGQLIVGYAPFFDLVALTELRHSLEQLHRHIKFQFHPLSSEEQTRLIRDECLDAGLVMLPVCDGDRLTIEPVMRDTAMLLVANSHPLAAGRQAALAHLAGIPIIQIRGDFISSQYDQANRISVLCGVQLQTGRYVPSLEKLLQAVRQSEGAALLPSSVRGVCGDGIKCLRIRDRNADFTFGVAYRRDGLTRTLTKFLAVARQLNHRLVEKREHSSPIAISR
jgi:DNA-binding transcriptional LysR family regulator